MASKDATHDCSGLFGDLESMVVVSIDRSTDSLFLLMCDFGTLSHAPTDKAMTPIELVGLQGYQSIRHQ